MKYFFVAGEASGDMHASQVAKEIYGLDGNAVIKGWGGDKMAEVGVAITKHFNELAIIGFVEVLKYLPTIFKNFQLCIEQIQAFSPDVVVLVDFGGFNLRLAKKLRKAGYQGKISYFIPPKIWAWNTKRIEKIKRYVNQVLTIFPFENTFYLENGFIHAIYVGNPLINKIAAFQRDKTFFAKNNLPNKPIVALLPGSRKGEINNMLPIMVQVAAAFPNVQFVIAGMAIHKNLYQQIINSYPIACVCNQTYQLLHHSKAAIVTSGTATLETALFGVPQLVCYRGNTISYWLAKQVVKVKHISLVNLILDKPLLKEFIQNKMTITALKGELMKLLNHNDYRTQQIDGYRQLEQKVGTKGAAKRAANEIVTLLRS